MLDKIPQSLMNKICAIFTHFANQENSLTCIRRLAQQEVLPQYIILINNASPDDPCLQEARELTALLFSKPVLHILQTEKNIGNAGGCARGLDCAFRELGADFVWILDDDSWARPQSLRILLEQEVDATTIRMSLIIDPAKGDELSWPLSAKSFEQKHWKHIAKRAELPDGPVILSRGGWLGALYPRAAWEKVGSPTEALFIRGEDEEYPWKLRQAGFQFITLRDSVLEHPSSCIALMEYKIGNRSFFYEPGLQPSRHYYKNRNWAWLQRQRYPKQYLRLAAAITIYIIFSLNAMISTRELSIIRFYQLMRALHNGYHQQLRPY